ncbi:hypothetical protein QYQ98_01375 [Corynebacterium sp. P3-F1]|uniref:hypothetical protein n=1 Tax=Corynebacterium sp. P3-F1 TaxID=3059080 RepID=UPI00265CAB00|nr:hypothetical protein [Corynebacterium sp. P3-F1]WKK61583.1 hypothetical protein QYQ98_01375 [Corynebacterium sp. P3-F1]
MFNDYLCLSVAPHASAPWPPHSSRAPRAVRRQPHRQFDEQTEFGCVGEYTITRHTDGSLSLDRIRFMPTYTVGMTYTPDYKLIPLADATELGWVDVQQSRAHITSVMNTCTPVEVFDYLD